MSTTIPDRKQPVKTFFECEVERIMEKGLPPHYYAYVRQSRAFMDKYHSEGIDLDKMAAAAFMSRFHYIRVFQQVYGRTPRKYLQDLRIEKAKELLREGRPVTEVCFNVGYESPATFSRIFKRGTGYSPKVYQEINIRNPG